MLYRLAIETPLQHKKPTAELYD